MSTQPFKRDVIYTPINDSILLPLGSIVKIHGQILVGRDAALPKLVHLIHTGQLAKSGIDLVGAAIFHTAVSPAGIGPTSSNKFDIESCIPELSRAGVKMHIGKGSLQPGTVAEMSRYGSVFAVTPPLSALLGSTVVSQRVLAFPELGMEALHLLEVRNFPAIIAAARGESLNPGGR